MSRCIISLDVKCNLYNVKILKRLNFTATSVVSVCVCAPARARVEILLGKFVAITLLHLNAFLKCVSFLGGFQFRYCHRV